MYNYFNIPPYFYINLVKLNANTLGVGRSTEENVEQINLRINSAVCTSTINIVNELGKYLHI